jgi:hypothetical protein
MPAAHSVDGEVVAAVVRVFLDAGVAEFDALASVRMRESDAALGLQIARYVSSETRPVGPGPVCGGDIQPRIRSREADANVTADIRREKRLAIDSDLRIRRVEDDGVGSRAEEA